MIHRVLVCVALVSLGVSNSVADELKAAPGDGTITAAAAKAKAGDTIVLEAGEYHDSVQLPADVTLKGAGSGKTILIPSGPVAINCDGARVTISGLTVRHAEGCRRGVNTMLPVRVERCRFESVPEAVALMDAPLSDVVACEFDGCDIGVRAIGGASPTVWGCRFKGGEMGIFEMEGMPYIRDNLFQGCETGIRLIASDNPDQAIIRSNVLSGCTKAGIEIESKGAAVFGLSIRNNLFDGCGAAVIEPVGMARTMTHNLAHASGNPAFHDKDGKTIGEISEKGNGEADAKITFGGDGSVAIGNEEAVMGKGIGAARGEKGDIGLEKGWARPGCSPEAALPPKRFGDPMIANSVAEEYAYLRSQGLGMGEQGLRHENGKSFDVLSVTGPDGKKLELKFDISRFFDERGL